ncbi:MAG: beta-mannosidase [Anaerolineae bacterium]
MTIKIHPHTVELREVGAEAWLPAEIPGSAHTALLALDKIPDPFVADNELRVQWVAERDWEYRLRFEADAVLRAEERVWLVCEGLDTLAEVFVNGKQMGSTDNMFRRYTWDVTGELTEGENEVRVLLHGPLPYLRARHAEEPLPGPTHSIPGGPHLRKAPSQFGWDWGPKLPPVGIWKEVWLEGYTAARLADVHLRQHHDDGDVTLSVDLTVERWRDDAALKAMLIVKAPDGETWAVDALLDGDATHLALDVLNPRLWWPNGYGDQPLYDVEVTLYADDVLCDTRTFQIGLRTLELQQEADEFGTSFIFVVNGVPIFAKGANWIPADSFPSRISGAQLEHLIRSAAEVHMNMLRVWGGGFYEEERFYDLCDRYGILVWQDFIFSCSIYPRDEAFFENVRQEAIENIRRLRHRASLALWCGNNEMEWGWDSWGWDQPRYRPYKEAYDRLFHRLLPELVAEEDPDTPYWPSSPSSNLRFIRPNATHAGDTHNWEVWHQNRPFRAYREHPSRFVSEFGFQSLPPLETIRTYAAETDWNMTSYIMEHHQRNDAGNGKIITYLTDHFRMPKDFPALVYLTQILQAEAVRTGVEFWRRSKACTGGTLYWQLNDCWPVASWASLDYFGRWKALHYAARRFYAPVHLSAEDCGPEVGPQPLSDPHAGQRTIEWTVKTPDGETVNSGERTMSQEAIEELLQIGKPVRDSDAPLATLYVTNDLTEPWEGLVRWSLETLDGEVLREGQDAVSVPALDAVQVCALDFSAQVTAENRREVVLVYALYHGDKRLSLDVMPFAPNKHLKLSDPGLSLDVRRADGGFEIILSAARLARFVQLSLEGREVVFSDNYFDVPAGRSVTVSFPAPEAWTVDAVRDALRVQSLVDSF